MSSNQETNLVTQAKHGDRLALEKLLIDHLDILRNHIARRTPTKFRHLVDHDDITQQALLEAYLKIGRLRETSPAAFVTWLKAIGEMTLLRTMRDLERKKRGGQYRQVQASEMLDEHMTDLLDCLPSEAKTASSYIARRQAVTALRVAVAGLSDEQREAVQLHLIKGMSIDETAQSMNKTTAAIRGLIHRGKQNLSQALGRASDWLGRA